MTKAERFARLNGIEWSKLQINTDGLNCHRLQPNNPTYADAKSILEVLMDRDDWEEFVPSIGTFVGGIAHIHIYYIRHPDKLLEEAVKYSLL